MPTFVINAIGKITKLLTLDEPPVSVGRHYSCEIALESRTVSRNHAVFIEDEDHQWHVGCVSETNPIVVDGVLVTTTAGVNEGTEILVGSDYLIIFSENEEAARQYLGRGRFWAKGRCVKCEWAGLVSTLQKEHTCPRCSSEVVSLREYKRRAAPASVQDLSTLKMTPGQIKEKFQQIHTAKRSRIERIDGRDDNARRDLSEDHALVLGKGQGSELKLFGIGFGDGVRVTWDRDHYVVESSMSFPTMKVNGDKTQNAHLKAGDVIEIGSNRFRFVTE